MAPAQEGVWGRPSLDFRSSCSTWGTVTSCNKSGMMILFRACWFQSGSSKMAVLVAMS